MAEGTASPIMLAAERAAKIVATWSKAKQDYAKRVVDSGDVNGEVANDAD